MMFQFARSPVAVLLGLLTAAFVPWLASQTMSHEVIRSDAAEVARLDTEYQAAVERNDAAAMGRILHEEFVLVLGDGLVRSREDLLRSAREAHVVYEYQVEEPGTQAVRVWGDAAVVTALLALKGRRDGRMIERRLWFSDTYVRTAAGWRYAFGQASLPLPPR